LKVEFNDDGEFFMIFKDFLEFFDRIELCHISPGQLTTVDDDKNWFLSEFNGEFNPSPPQIIVKLVDPDEFDDDDYCTLVVSLMQMNCRNQGLPNGFIKFDIFKLNSSDVSLSFLPTEAFMPHNLVGSEKFQPFREICARFRLLPGYYAIIPQTMTRNGKFLMRLFTESMKHGETGNVIVKVNENLQSNGKLESVKTEMKIDIFTVDDALPRANTRKPERKRKRSEVERCFLWLLLMLMVTFIAFSLLFSGVWILDSAGHLKL
jgi:hypothetical protein